MVMTMAGWRKRLEPNVPFVAGATLLLTAMGIGRFAYTPLLPTMRLDAGLTLQMAGLLASFNLAGYLIGALIAMSRVAHVFRIRFIATASAAIVVTTAAMSLSSDIWIPARFVTGVGSGVVFVLTVSLMLDLASRTNSRAGMSVLFCGVGAGIIAAGCFSPVFVAIGGSRFAWRAFAVIAAVASIASIIVLGKHEEPTKHSPPSTAEAKAGAGFGWLLLLYGVEGAAYVIPATFLSAMAGATPGIGILRTMAWPVVGLVALPSAMFWNSCSRRLGHARALIAAAIVQAVSMLSPFFLSPPLAIVIVSAALGGTFIGLTAIGTALGRTLMPGRGNVAVGVLTGIYGIGQIIGPLVATRILVETGSYRFALLASSLPLLVATLIFALAFRKRLAPQVAA